MGRWHMYAFYICYGALLHICQRLPPHMPTPAFLAVSHQNPSVAMLCALRCTHHRPFLFYNGLAQTRLAESTTEANARRHSHSKRSSRSRQKKNAAAICNAGRRRGPRHQGPELHDKMQSWIHIRAPQLPLVAGIQNVQQHQLM